MADIHDMQPSKQELLDAFPRIASVNVSSIDDFDSIQQA